jgi:hypothetical protein
VIETETRFAAIDAQTLVCNGLVPVRVDADTAPSRKIAAKAIVRQSRLCKNQTREKKAQEPARGFGFFFARQKLHIGNSERRKAKG